MASLSKLSLSNSTSPAISFSSSLSSSPLRWRRSAAVPARPRRRLAVVQAKIREIFMPALSSTMTEGKIVSWVKSEGDVLSKGESVVVVESDKADMDVETFYDGILAAIVVPEGETAPVGAPIGLLAETEEEIAEAKARAAQSGPKSGSSAPPKAETPVPAASPAPAAAPPTMAPAAEGPRKVVATPFAKKLAKQHKVDLNSIIGSGPFGRITPEDVERAAGIVAPKKPAVVAPGPAAAAASPSPKMAGGSGGNFAEIPGSSVVPFTTMQAAVAKNMVESLSVPTFRVGYVKEGVYI